jgi:hypothetical protein
MQGSFYLYQFTRSGVAVLGLLGNSLWTLDKSITRLESVQAPGVDPSMVSNELTHKLARCFLNR